MPPTSQSAREASASSSLSSPGSHAAAVSTRAGEFDRSASLAEANKLGWVARHDVDGLSSVALTPGRTAREGIETGSPSLLIVARSRQDSACCVSRATRALLSAHVALGQPARPLRPAPLTMRARKSRHLARRRPALEHSRTSSRRHDSRDRADDRRLVLDVVEHAHHDGTGPEG